jgi:hypothetical protein
LRVRTVVGGLLGLVVALVVNLLRTGGHGALDTIWIEDSITFLNQAYNDQFGHVIFRPESGYYQILPKTYAEIAGALPVRYAAPALAVMAAGTWAVVALIAFMASRPYLPTWPLRLLVAAPVVLVPVGHSQADNDVATLHFPALYALFWLMLWQPVTRLGKVVAVVATALAATSSILAVVFIPLAVLRLVAVRSWGKRVVALVYLAGMAVQVGGLVLGVSARDQNQKFNLFWALWQYVTVAAPRSLFGEKWLGGSKVDVGGMPTAAYGVTTPGELVLILSALGILVAVAACGLTGLTRPHPPLALLAAIFSVVVFGVSVVEMGTVEPRYVIAPALLLFVAVVATLRPRRSVVPLAVGNVPPLRSVVPSAVGNVLPLRSVVPPAVGNVPPLRRRSWSAVAILMFGVLLAGVCAVNYRVDNARATSPSWSQTIRDSSRYCRRDPHAPYVFFGYEWWSLQVPCDRLR